ncbi:MAG: endonuclease V [Halobacteriales archaeon]|nr:endonuclease V [Halobacteriales archaeon]
MEPVRPALAPDGSLSRERMRALQAEVAAAATFADDPPIDPSTVGERRVAGIDQAFLDDRAISAVVVRRGGETVERVHAVEPLEVPYVPGYLSFREGGPILAALGELEAEPDLLLFDGSGRIHYRQAGLATHLGVVLDAPSVGVAKGLLCGRPSGSLESLPAGSTVSVLADEQVDAPEGTVLGHAVQTRQFETGDRYVNPVYVSPGHRVGAETAAELALACTAGYKLPEPIRLADAYAAEVKASLTG